MSAPLHDAIACTVCGWLLTKNHFGTATSARPGSTGAAENDRLPHGRSPEAFPRPICAGRGCHARLPYCGVITMGVFRGQRFG
jgi:hypothetical protein